jgi:hypothetical protein
MTRGRKTGGRTAGSKNRVTVEREERVRLEIRAQIEAEKRAKDARLKAAGVETLEDAKALASKEPKLMKEIAFDFARLFAGLATFYQPYPQWVRDPETGKIRNANPNFDEAKFKEYAVLAKDTALGAASYQSPKLSAVMVGSDVINEIIITGGLPDDQDGGLVDATEDSPAYIGGHSAEPSGEASKHGY